jgi:hypothetical protein
MLNRLSILLLGAFLSIAALSLPAAAQNLFTNPLPVTVGAPASGQPSTDISGTVTSGGSYQTVAAANPTRKNCTIQNPTTASEVLNVKFGTMAQPYTLSAGQAISAVRGIVVATDAITVMGATTAHAFAGTCQ